MGNVIISSRIREYRKFAAEVEERGGKLCECPDCKELAFKSAMVAKLLESPGLLPNGDDQEAGQ